LIAVSVVSTIDQDGGKPMSFMTQKKIGFVILFLVVVLSVFFVLHKMQQQKNRTNTPDSTLIDINSVSDSKEILDYGRLKDDEALSALMKERKQKYGIDDGIDMIVKSDEYLRVGDQTVSMEEIVDETLLQRGELVEKDMKKLSRLLNSKTEDFGIHVVLPGENIWNIHFNLLKNYFTNKQITLPDLADEPGKNGYSSGVGKILKFSEKMVYIYNVKKRKLESDIHQLQPLSKIVVYNMAEVFSLLDPIDYSNVQQIRFDGETIWVTNE